MTKLSKVFLALAILAAIGIIIYGVFIFTEMPLTGQSAAHLIKEYYNPSKTTKAVLFLKEGGTTTDDSYQVSVLPAKNRLDSLAVGNVFTFDNNHSTVKIDTGSTKLVWLNDKKLRIVFDKRLRTFFMEKQIANITIQYQSR